MGPEIKEDNGIRDDNGNIRTPIFVIVD